MTTIVAMKYAILAAFLTGCETMERTEPSTVRPMSFQNSGQPMSFVKPGDQYARYWKDGIEYLRITWPMEHAGVYEIHKESYAWANQ